MKAAISGNPLAGAGRKACVSQYPNNRHAQLTGKTARDQIPSNASEQLIHDINCIKYSNSSEFCLQDVSQQCPIQMNQYLLACLSQGGHPLNPRWVIVFLWLRLNDAGLKDVILKKHFTRFGPNSPVSYSSATLYSVWSHWYCAEVKICVLKRGVNISTLCKDC